MTNGSQSKKPTSGPQGEAGSDRGGWRTERRDIRKGNKRACRQKAARNKDSSNPLNCSRC